MKLAEKLADMWYALTHIHQLEQDRTQVEEGQKELETVIKGNERYKIQLEQARTQVEESQKELETVIKGSERYKIQLEQARTQLEKSQKTLDETVEDNQKLFQYISQSITKIENYRRKIQQYKDMIDAISTKAQLDAATIAECVDPFISRYQNRQSDMETLEKLGNLQFTVPQEVDDSGSFLRYVTQDFSRPIVLDGESCLILMDTVTDKTASLTTDPFEIYHGVPSSPCLETQRTVSLDYIRANMDMPLPIGRTPYVTDFNEIVKRECFDVKELQEAIEKLPPYHYGDTVVFYSDLDARTDYDIFVQKMRSMEIPIECKPNPVLLAIEQYRLHQNKTANDRIDKFNLREIQVRLDAKNKLLAEMRSRREQLESRMNIIETEQSVLRDEKYAYILALHPICMSAGQTLDAETIYHHIAPVLPPPEDDKLLQYKLLEGNIAEYLEYYKYFPKKQYNPGVVPSEDDFTLGRCLALDGKSYVITDIDVDNKMLSLQPRCFVGKTDADMEYDTEQESFEYVRENQNKILPIGRIDLYPMMDLCGAYHQIGYELKHSIEFHDEEQFLEEIRQWSNEAVRGRIVVYENLEGESIHTMPIYAIEPYPMSISCETNPAMLHLVKEKDTPEQQGLVQDELEDEYDFEIE